MWWDADIDAMMRRTKSRPVPAGMVQPGEALAIGLALSGISVVMLALATNMLAAGAAGVHDLLLRRGLFDVAEALDAAEHRDWRGGGGVPADDRLGGGHRVCRRLKRR